MSEYRGVEIYCVFGQHDQYMYSHDTRSATNLGILAEMGLVTILDEEPLQVAGGMLTLYGSGEGEKVPKIHNANKNRILVIHESISDRPLWPGHDIIQAKRFLLQNKDFDLILCGDIHRQFLIQLGDRAILNTGPMVRKTVDLWDHEPCFYVYDTETKWLKKEIIPHEPPEKVLSRTHIDEKAETNDMLDEFIATMNARQVSGTSFEDNLRKFIQDNEIEDDVIGLIAEVMEKKNAQ